MQVVEVNDQLVMLKVSGRLHFFCFTSIIHVAQDCCGDVRGELSASFSGDPHYGVRHYTETQPTSWYLYFSDQRSQYKQRDCHKLL